MSATGDLRLGEEHQVRHDTRKNAGTTCAHRSDVSCDSLSRSFCTNRRWRRSVNNVKVHFCSNLSVPLITKKER